MAISTREKLDGNLPEFLEDVRRLTLWPALEKWGLEASYLPVRKIITEETGDENFGLPKAGTSYATDGIKGLLRELVATFADYAIRKEKENTLMRQMLDAYQSNGRKTELACAGEIVGLVEVLKFNKEA